MKNKLAIIIIIITVIGMFLGLTYEKPDIKIYNQLNKIDQTIISAQTHEDLSYTEVLEQFYETINTIIQEATTSDKENKISFETYETQFALLARMTQNLFNTLEESTQNLSDNELFNLEKQRLTLLKDLTEKVGILLENTGNLEEVVYTAKPSQAKSYVLDLQKTFDDIQNIQHTYSDTYKTYLEAKTVFYQDLK